MCLRWALCCIIYGLEKVEIILVGTQLSVPWETHQAAGVLGDLPVKHSAQAGQKSQGATKIKPDNNSNSKGKAVFKKCSLKDFEFVNIL